MKQYFLGYLFEALVVNTSPPPS